MLPVLLVVAEVPHNSGITPGSKPRQFLKVLQQLMEEPFDEREANLTDLN